MSRSNCGTPATIARYCFSTVRALNWAASASWAWSFLATTITPLVSRSSRWTMPGRVGPPRWLIVPKWWASAPASVPSQCPFAGWTIIPAGFVHDDDRVVLVQDVERDVLRHGPFARHVELRAPRRHCPRAACSDGLHARIVHANVPGFDRPLQRGPAERRQPLGKKHVEPLAGRFGRNRE